MTTEIKLDQDTCEAIAARLRVTSAECAPKSECITEHGLLIAADLVSEWAMEQPAPPAATPTAGAVRALDAIYKQQAVHSNETTPNKLATLIDRETGLRDLVAACQALDNCDLLEEIENGEDIVAARDLAHAALTQHETGG
jgi:hypothetical protein